MNCSSVLMVVVVVSSIEWLLALSRVCIFVCNGRRRTRAAIVTYEYVHVMGDRRTRRREEGEEEEGEEEAVEEEEDGGDDDDDGDE